MGRSSSTSTSASATAEKRRNALASGRCDEISADGDDDLVDGRIKFLCWKRERRATLKASVVMLALRRRMAWSPIFMARDGMGF